MLLMKNSCLMKSQHFIMLSVAIFHRHQNHLLLAGQLFLHPPPRISTLCTEPRYPESNLYKYHEFFRAAEDYAKVKMFFVIVLRIHTISHQRVKFIVVGIGFDWIHC
ncbi:hypothetical protein L6452_16862 [Arctium lappa]|uniref:Uncharacterized protein n=1 Tax=Arctium lappa TaxID=4217 RepID=A0ACB9C202_ARCLA|nr:hypothetical protein L6452_16862 [Arctium lappa]